MHGQARAGGSDLWYAPVYCIQYLVDSVLQRQVIGEFSPLQLEGWGERQSVSQSVRGVESSLTRPLFVHGLDGCHGKCWGAPRSIAIKKGCHAWNFT